MLRSQVYLSRVTVGDGFFPPVLYFFPYRRQTPLARPASDLHEGEARGHALASIRPVLVLFLDTQEDVETPPGIPPVERRRHRQHRYSVLSRLVFWIQRCRFSAPASRRGLSAT